MAGSEPGAASPPAAQWVERAEAELRRCGHRSTLPRSLVIGAIGRQDCVLSADQIAEELKRGTRRVGTATIYRTLELLEGLGLVQRLDVGDGLARFEPALPGGEHHHHHYVCAECDRVTPFEDEELERAIEALSSRLGGRVQSHEVILRGGCSNDAHCPLKPR